MKSNKFTLTLVVDEVTNPQIEVGQTITTARAYKGSVCEANIIYEKNFGVIEMRDVEYVTDLAECMIRESSPDPSGVYKGNTQNT